MSMIKRVAAAHMKKPRNLEEALQPWIPGIKLERLEETATFEIISGKVDDGEEHEDTRFDYSYGSINGVHGRVYTTKQSSINGKFHLCLDPSQVGLKLGRITRKQSNQALVYLKPYIDDLIDEVYYDAISDVLYDEEWYGDGHYASMDITGVFIKRGKLCLSLKGYLEASEPVEVEDDFDYYP
jgi:hypothetical protein